MILLKILAHLSLLNQIKSYLIESNPACFLFCFPGFLLQIALHRLVNKQAQQLNNTHITCRSTSRHTNAICTFLSIKVYFSMIVSLYLAGLVLEELRHIVASASLLWHLSIKLKILDFMCMTLPAFCCCATTQGWWPRSSCPGRPGAARRRHLSRRPPPPCSQWLESD